MENEKFPTNYKIFIKILSVIFSYINYSVHLHNSIMPSLVEINQT